MLGQSLQEAVAGGARNAGSALHVHGRDRSSGIGNGLQDRDEPIQMHKFHNTDISLT